MDKLRKEIHMIFQKEGLSIECERNLKSVEFLDAKFDLNQENCNPFKKPSAKVEYVPVGSNHPPKVVKISPKLWKSG